MKVSFKYSTKTQQGRCESSLSVHSTVKALYLHKQIVAIYDSEFSFATFDTSILGCIYRFETHGWPRFIIFCRKAREVNLKTIFFKLRSGHDWRSSMRSDAGPEASGAGPTDRSRRRPSRPVPVSELTIFLRTDLHKATVSSTCIYTAMFH